MRIIIKVWYHIHVSFPFSPFFPYVDCGEVTWRTKWDFYLHIIFQVEQAKCELELSGLKCYSVSMGGSGVRVWNLHSLWLVIFRPGTKCYVLNKCKGLCFSIAKPTCQAVSKKISVTQWQQMVGCLRENDQELRIFLQHICIYNV